MKFYRTKLLKLIYIYIYTLIILKKKQIWVHCPGMAVSLVT